MTRPEARLPVRIICAALMAPATADVGRTIYQWVTGFPPVNWSITGRWFLKVLAGQPYEPQIGTIPALPHELWAGHAAYYTISLIFAAAYVIGLQLLGRRPSLANGLGFGWVTMVFPFLVQMPEMGMGVFAHLTQTPGLIIGRTLVHHSSFGLGLALGAMLANGLFRRGAK